MSQRSTLLPLLLIALPGALLTCLLFPGEAMAWGPATHLELGRAVLLNPAFLPAAIRTLLLRYPHDFYYGNVSADIVVAKNMVTELKHCHNWSFGFKLLKKSESDSQRAFSYGYLSHLAADTVAHNHFIPEMVVRSFSTRIMRHVYWEMRFDALADKRVWRLPEKIAQKVHRDNDALLSATLEDTPLSFRTNKTIFSSIMNLHKVDHWHRMMDMLSNNSKWVLHKYDKDRYFSLALEAVMDVLKEGNRSGSLKKDPTGRQNLKRAMESRKNLKRLKKRGANWQDPMVRAVSAFTMYR